MGWGTGEARHFNLRICYAIFWTFVYIYLKCARILKNGKFPGAGKVENEDQAVLTGRREFPGRRGIQGAGKCRPLKLGRSETVP